MTIKDVKARVAQVKGRVEIRDYDDAHCLEDDLFQDVLRAVAKGDKRSQALAQAALESRKLVFNRHTA